MALAVLQLLDAKRLMDDAAYSAMALHMCTFSNEPENMLEVRAKNCAVLRPAVSQAHIAISKCPLPVTEVPFSQTTSFMRQLLAALHECTESLVTAVVSSGVEAVSMASRGAEGLSPRWGST